MMENEKLCSNGMLGAGQSKNSTAIQKCNFATGSRYLPSQYIKGKHFARYGGCRPYS